MIRLLLAFAAAFVVLLFLVVGLVDLGLRSREDFLLARRGSAGTAGPAGIPPIGRFQDGD